MSREPKAGELKERGKTRLAETWSDLRPNTVIDRSGYVSDFRENLVDGVDPDLFEANLRAGRGNELKAEGECKGKFLAVHSSSAAAVNTFAPWKRDFAAFEFAGVSRFTSLKFEDQCNVFAWGNPANLDVVGEAPDDIVAVESKLLELMDSAKVVFSPKYSAIDDVRCDSRWFAQIAALGNSKQPFRRLKADQLVRHALGLMNCYQKHRIALVYLYWEPVNAADFQEYVLHREEVAAFTEALQGDPLRFVPMTYAELWEDWSGRTDPAWLSDHVARLLARYEVSI